MHSLTSFPHTCTYALSCVTCRISLTCMCNPHSSFYTLPHLSHLNVSQCTCFLFFVNQKKIFWLCWVFVAVHRLLIVVASLVAEHRALDLQASLVAACGLSSCDTWAQQLWHVGSAVVARGVQSAGSVVVVHGLSCSAACGIFSDQGSNPCPLHWQADS